jgi:diguanylate cyclase (GGDEF)-like protein
MRAQLRVRGRTVGVMTVATMVDRVFGASDLIFMAAVADQVAMAIDRARQFASEARTDHLTGLANRREFERVMEREVALAERHKRRLSLMMIDLDNLKRLNDRQGHRAGDGALRLVAQQLQRVVRASDVCARVGGDEFAVAMPETDIDRARDVAMRLRRAIDHVAMSVKSPEAVEVSVGIAAWRAGQDWQTVYQAADSDLYEDKRRRKTVRRWQQEDRPTPAIRLLGRTGSGRRRVSGA